MITKAYNAEDFIPKLIWDDYFNLVHLDIEEFVFRYSTLVNNRNLFENSVFDCIMKQCSNFK